VSTKCAYPSFATRFHRFNERKLFPLTTPAWKEEYFRLCGKCSYTKALMPDGDSKPQVRSTPIQVCRHTTVAPHLQRAQSDLFTQKPSMQEGGGRYGLRSGRRE
jgi:hypothetical protein